jgi:potassium-transporting ATPase KdpC subunit
MPDNWKRNNRKPIMRTMASRIIPTLRLALAIWLFCSAAYPLLVGLFARWVVPNRAIGTLVQNEAGQDVGSLLVAQPFTLPGYFWPRPSAVNFDGSASGGSNLSPAGPIWRNLLEQRLTRFHATPQNPVPIELLTASGSGLDPHITLAAARFQLSRVAAVRGVTPDQVERLLQRLAEHPGDLFSHTPLINVLQVNLALDRLEKR